MIELQAAAWTLYRAEERATSSRMQARPISPLVSGVLSMAQKEPTDSDPEYMLGVMLGGLWEAPFVTQHPFGPYTLDFAYLRVRLDVEIDGKAHETPERARKDRRRDEYLRDRGWNVLRVPARDVYADAASVARVVLLRYMDLLSGVQRR